MAFARTPRFMLSLVSLSAVAVEGLLPAQPAQHGFLKPVPEASVASFLQFQTPSSPEDLTGLASVEESASLSDDMMTYKYVARSLTNGTVAWMDSQLVYERVPDYMEGATVFAGPYDLTWTGILTLEAYDTGFAYIWANNKKDGGIASLPWEQVGNMRWETKANGNEDDGGAVVIYRKAVEQGEWVDVPIKSRWIGGVAFKKDPLAKAAVAAAPTGTSRTIHKDYTYFGCRSTTKLVDHIERDDPLSMTIQRCFMFCSERANTVYFGLENGRKCWCAPIFYGGRLEQKKCDTPCDGNPKQTCGGIGASSVHTLINCNKEDMEKPVVKPIVYIEKKGRTCGGSPNWFQGVPSEGGGERVKVDDKENLVGTVEACKKACSDGRGGHECGAFTYDRQMSKCTFLVSGSSSWYTEVPYMSCYHKDFPLQEK